MGKRFLFVDLDQTLLNTDKSISDVNISAINRFLDEGNLFAFVTGRPFVDSCPFAEEYGLCREGVFIASFNGGEIWEFKGNSWNRIYSAPVSFEDARLLFSEAEKQGIHCQTYAGKFVIALHYNDILKGYTKGRHLVPKAIEDLDDLLNSLPAPPPKLVCVAENDRPGLQRFRELVDPLIKGRLFSIFSSDRLLEFGDLNATKGSALLCLAEREGVRVQDTVAAGDEENDISMIEAAGIGYAMKNAIDPVKNAADRITAADNDHGAIAEIIGEMLGWDKRSDLC